VTLSNVVYAHSMQIVVASTGGTHVFASWDARVVQHILLYPLLIGCVYFSLRTGWRPAWRAWPVQVLLGLVFSALASPLLMLAERITRDETYQHKHVVKTMADFWKGPEPAVWLSSVTNFLLTYGFCLALVTGFSLYQRYRDSQLRVTALERAWSTARLATLRMQLSPHTLFNLLHTIRGQIGWDPQKAQAMVVQLGDLLRRLLSAGERDFSRLSDELHFTYSYLELQKQRFPDRLTLHFPQVEVLPAVWVPSLILQPLVENAVVHGLSGHEGPVTVRIEIDSHDQQHLIVRITNTMAPERATGREGVGLRNVRERLAVQFGEKASLVAQPAENGEWVATVSLPLLRDGPTVTKQDSPP
jgi:Histidine kinase